MKTEEKLNMTMLCDFYELTMGNGYFQTGFKDRITYFDVYFRSVSNICTQAWAIVPSAGTP